MKKFLRIDLNLYNYKISQSITFEITKEPNLGMIGMPELLFRANMARHMSPASVVDNIIDYYDFIENRIKFLKNRSASHLEAEKEYVFNDYMREQDYFMKTSLHYNSLFFRSCYSLNLIQELAKTQPNLLVVVDPLVNRHFAEILESKKYREEFGFICVFVDFVCVFVRLYEFVFVSC